MGIAEAIHDKTVYWHRELPPLDASPMGEHTIEAVSRRVQNSLDSRDELWTRYYDDLMDRIRVRLEQEVTRLGGDFAHILDESVDTRHDDRTGQAWLHGTFTYMLYGRKEGERTTPISPMASVS
ncbi:MAG TPA: hypothetical protein VJS43_15960 [Candidatus Acidoferrales bacterium]|nr:hypothetical protein [Candidatus Acidoferrales bacterium]